MPSGDSSPNWKGGRTETNGYIRKLAPGHPRASKSRYVLEHILVMESQLGRFLLPNERVHHKNGRRDDNRPENLELWRMKDRQELERLTTIALAAHVIECRTTQA